MPQYEYALREFKLVEKWNSKKQAEQLAVLADELTAMGAQGWQLHGLHTFDLVGGITGSSKGKISLTVWQKEVKPS
jgi:hypothetical protein